MSRGTPVRVALVGALGRMGREIAAAAASDDGVSVVGAVEAPGHPGLALPERVGGVCVTDDRNVALEPADVLIDFTAPAALRANVAAAVGAGKAMVIGTTGLDADAIEVIRVASRTVPVVFAPNMSIGVNVMLGLLRTAARALGPAYDVEVLEAHHRHKVDAPSGTAMRMADVLCDALERNREADLRYGRQGAAGPRSSSEIGMQVIRGGDVAGEHTVFFLGEGERVEITHRASSRSVFAKGALRAAKWVAGKPPGLYGMEHVLDL